TQGKVVDWIRHSHSKAWIANCITNKRVVRNEDLRKIIISAAARYSTLALKYLPF
ncbi:Hypothetical protein FKW44_017342, partial [Caligus rogercresseyi]